MECDRSSPGRTELMKVDGRYSCGTEVDGRLRKLSRPHQKFCKVDARYNGRIES